MIRWEIIDMIACVCFVLLVGAVSCGDDVTAKLRFYQGSVDNYIEYHVDKAHKIMNSSWFNPNRTTVIFAHGFTGHPNGPAVTAVMSAYLGQNTSNVALLNWEEMAADSLTSFAGSYLNWAVPNARKLGSHFAGTLLTMASSGLDLDKVHLVGHSLGAHIFGIAGNVLLEKGIMLPWITGLDPARVSFDGRPQTRLNPRSALFVDVIHSDPNKYGYRRSLGTADFWPNFRAGPVVQPGCDNRNYPNFSPEDLCNHNRCWELLIDSIKYPGTLLGSYAKNYRTWKNYSDLEREAVLLELGTFKEDAVPGNYYLITKAKSPFGLGISGI